MPKDSPKPGSKRVSSTPREVVSAAPPAKRAAFRHGDLHRALLTAGLEMARLGGPEAIVLREATRQAGVSPNAAYRHFANQAALLEAVRSACVSRLAATIEAELAAVKPGRDRKLYARRSLMAVGRGYLGFAMREPGMFRTAFSVVPDIHGDNKANTASLGLNPFQLLSMTLDRMMDAGLLSKKDRQGAEFLAWSSVHGLALLKLEGPLHPMPPEAIEALGERLVHMVERGLSQ